MTEQDAIDAMTTEITVAGLVCKRRKSPKRQGSHLDDPDSQELLEECFTPSQNNKKNATRQECDT